jgi:hypothetical protein
LHHLDEASVKGALRVASEKYNAKTIMVMDFKPQSNMGKIKRWLEYRLARGENYADDFDNCAISLDSEFVFAHEALLMDSILAAHEPLLIQRSLPEYRCRMTYGLVEDSMYWAYDMVFDRI